MDTSKTIGRRLLILWGAGTLLLLATIIAFAAWTPSSDPSASICLFRHLGGSCPGCGMTRALALLVKGDVPGAFARHPLAPFLALETILLWLGAALWIVAGHRLLAPVDAARHLKPGWRLVNATIVAHGLALYAIWVVRLLRGASIQT